MHQQFSISPSEGKLAKWPHELFLINLIFNHIFVFVATLSVVGTFPYFPIVVPVISVSIIAYIIIQSKKILASDETWFIKAHWIICAKRNQLFILLLLVPCIVTVGGLWLSKELGWSKIQTLALIGGVGLLPFMVTLLILIILGNESVHLARFGRLPKSFLERHPELLAQATTHLNQIGDK